METIDRFGSCRLDWIGHSDDADCFSVGGHGHRRLAFSFESLCTIVKRAKRNLQLGEQCAVAEGGVAFADAACDALAGERAKIGDAAEFDAAIPRSGEDGCGERMLAGAL